MTTWATSTRAGRMAAILAALLAAGSGCGGSDDVGATPDGSATDAAGPRDGGAPPTDAPMVPGDAGVPSTCGNGTCEAGESCSSCEADCGMCTMPPVTECNDGIDNDGDGLVDWQYDVGCWSSLDGTEASGPRLAENGFTTFDLSPDSHIVYVSSSEGDDANDGSSPALAVATPARGAALVRDGFPDFLLFRRGDTWRAMDIGPDRIVRRFKSGRDADHRMVVASYGDSTERPRFELDKDFIDDDGHEKNFLAIVGLALVSFPKIPGDPGFDGATGGSLRFVSATGHDVLIEDNYVEYSGFTVQGVHDFEVRRNVVYRAYHVGTCAYNPDGSRNPNGNNMFRPSGIFAGGVDGLLIEGNVFDENGWNPDVPEACATIYDHDMYLSGNSRLTVRDNLVMRASSIGVKMASDTTGESHDLVLENNLFAEGEIGISMGGNGSDPLRFANAAIRDNVFTDIGRARPTTRTLTWYIDLIDDDATEISGNLLVNQPPLGNPFGIQVSGPSSRAVSIHDNFAYGLLNRIVVIDAAAAWSSVTIGSNTFVGTSTSDCLVDHGGGFANVTYTNNGYASAGPAARWFCVDGTRRSLAEWSLDSGETGATTAAVTPPDPTRNLDTYAMHLGLGSTLADFAAAARTLSRHTWRPELTPPNAANYIREGFGVAAR